MACLSAVTGKAEIALDYLARAAGRGFKNPAVMEDPDLNSLHGNARFKEIVGEMTGASR